VAAVLLRCALVESKVMIGEATCAMCSMWCWTGRLSFVVCRNAKSAKSAGE
jgi:hypothetical protein